MNWDTVCRKAIAYFEDNDDEFIAAIESLDSYNGCLTEGSGRYWAMWELDGYFYGMRASEILDAIDSDFSTSDDYFLVSQYDLISSSNEIDYSDNLDSDFIGALYDNKDDIDGDIPDYVMKLFEAYDEEDPDEESDDEEDEE